MSVRREKRAKKGEARRWRIDIVIKRDGRRERIRRDAPTREAALKLERRLRAELDEGRQIVAGPVLYRDWAGEFVKVYASNNNKESERRSKRQIMRDHLVPFFGDMRLDAIGYADVERFKAQQLARKAAAKSVNNRLTVLKRSLTIAVKSKKLAVSPEISLLKAMKPPFRFLSFEESRALLDGADAEWRTMILFAMRTGLRQGEMLALRWENVDLARARVHVREAVWRGVLGPPKGGKERTVDLSEETRAALQALPSRDSGTYVFGKGTVRLTAGETKWPLWRACKRVELKRCGWHVLRHTFASHLAMRGVAMKAIQELLGHTSMATTMRYAHLSPEIRSEAVQRLDWDPTKAPKEASL